MDCWTIVGSLGSIFGAMGSVAGIIAAIYIYRSTSKESQRIQEEAAAQERIRATLRDFPQVRRNNQNFKQTMRGLPDGERTLYMKTCLSQLEQFAVGINMDAYDLDVVNRMSGGMLVAQYKQYFKDFIQERRYGVQHSEVLPEKVYCEYEEMMRRLYEKRGLPWISGDPGKES